MALSMVSTQSVQLFVQWDGTNDAEITAWLQDAGFAVTISGSPKQVELSGINDYTAGVGAWFGAQWDWTVPGSDPSQAVYTSQRPIPDASFRQLYTPSTAWPT